jgi:hypothetical protein
LEAVLVHLSTSEGQADSLLGLSGSALKALDQVVTEMLVRAQGPHRGDLEALHGRLTHAIITLPAETEQS